MTTPVLQQIPHEQWVTPVGDWSKTVRSNGFRGTQPDLRQQSRVR